MIKHRQYFYGFVFTMVLAAVIIVFNILRQPKKADIFSYTVDTKTQNIAMFWKDDTGKILKTIANLKTYLAQKKISLKFAMNGGMFLKNYSPNGLYIQNYNVLSPIDTSLGEGNFYLMPNGVFYITSDSTAHVCRTKSFVNKQNVKWATQSGPMLVIDGQIHSSFMKGSNNLNIRNGVGILPNNKVVFAISKNKINFYDFAKYFKDLGCENALYLDGYVSRIYLPEVNETKIDGDFGVMLGVVEDNL